MTWRSTVHRHPQNSHCLRSVFPLPLSLCVSVSQSVNNNGASPHLLCFLAFGIEPLTSLSLSFSCLPPLVLSLSLSHPIPSAFLHQIFFLLLLLLLLLIIIIFSLLFIVFLLSFILGLGSMQLQIEERMVLLPENQMNHRHHVHHSAKPTGANSMASAAAAASAGRVMETQQALKCPRCDSSNTKFCYYNNYSLSQPRHFCKACKRYWTRGGTLRNVPVGGGCRKNKRIKKSSSTSAASSNPLANMVSDPSSLPLQISNLPIPPSSSGAIDPIFYGLHNNSTDLNHLTSFPAFLKRLDQRSGMPNVNSCNDQYDLNPHLNSMGLYFPVNNTSSRHQDYSNNLQFHPADNGASNIAPSTMRSTSLAHEFLLLGSSFSSSTTASLIAANLGQPKMDDNISGCTAAYDDIQASVLNGGGLGLLKDVKEGDRNKYGMNHNGRLEWQIPCNETPLENISAVDEPNSLYWNMNTSGIGNGWAETAATNCGPSVTPLI